MGHGRKESTSIDDIINYRYRSEKQRSEVILAAGASVSDVNIDGIAKGNKALALIGDALIRLVIVDQGYAEGAHPGEEHSQSKEQSKLTST